MYFDQPGTPEFTVPAGEADYEAEPTLDLDDDGVLDTTVLPHEDGSSTAFTDTDGDGRADLRTRLDGDGQITGRATYDPAGGEWVPKDETEPTPPGQITVRTPDGELDAGPATSDTVGDGTPDTVLITDPAGDTVLYTDADGDGIADLSTEITASGQVVVSEHTGHGQWTDLERTQLGGELPDAAVGDEAWTPAPENPVSVDPETGLWIRR